METAETRGFTKGQEATLKSTARKMKAMGLSVDMITGVTGLSPEEIGEL